MKDHTQKVKDVEEKYKKKMCDEEVETFSLKLVYLRIVIFIFVVRFTLFTVIWEIFF